MDRVVSTLIGVVVAVGVSAIIFIGINKLFDVAPRRWQWFTTLLGASASLGTFLILWGNRAIEQPVLWTIVATVVGGVVGFLLGQLEDMKARLIVGAAGGGILGLIVGLKMRDVILVFQDGNKTTEVGTPMPALNIGETLIWVAVFAAVGVGIWALRGRRKPIVRSLVFWGTVGWGIGAFAAGDLGVANRQKALIACIVFGVGIGASMGLIPFTGERRRVEIESGSRKYIFLTPALFFIGASLVVPTIRTFWLSFLDRTGDKAVGLANYSEVFGDTNIINVTNWTGIFGSALFQFGLAIIILGFVAAYFISARRGDEGMAFGAGTLSPIVIGSFVIAMAIFATLRGTIINNLWWVFTVTAVA
ncbi:MAG: sugar ABC transporter permease, partial [bacterium]|nr:sugar ABC transporter permease [bacterium]